MIAGTHPGQIVAGFSGEDAVTPELVLPPNMSPDARNIDYGDGTIRKRKGFERYHADAIRLGGVAVSGNALLADAHVAIPEVTEGWSAADSWFMEFYCRVEGPLASVVFWSAEQSTSPWYGYSLQPVLSGGSSTDRVFRLFYLGYPAAESEYVESSVVLETGVTYRVLVGAYEDDIGALTLILSVNGTVDSHTLTTITQIMAPLAGRFGHLGSTTLLDEVRLWYFPAGVAFWAGVSPFVSEDRELTDSERAHANLAGYWPLNDYNMAGAVTVADRSQNSNDGSLVGDGLWWSSSLIDGTGVPAPVVGIGHTVSDRAVERVIAATPGDVWALDGSVMTRLYPLVGGTENRTSLARFRGRLVITNGADQNYRYDATNGLRVLTPSRPDASGTTATSGAAGSLTGVRKYRFRFVDSTDYTASASSTDEVASPNVTSEKIDLSGIPQPNEPGVDTVEVLATKMGGAVYYHHSYVSAGTATLEDNTLDAALVTEEDPYVGKAAPSRFCVVHKESVFLGSQADEPSRLVFSEPGTMGAHYYLNFVDCGRGDGDEVTGAVSVGGVLLVTKTYSLWAVAGESAASYSVQKLYAGEGSIGHATIAASARAVYYMTPSGVARLPLPLGEGPPEDITDHRYRNLFEALAETDRQHAAGAWDPVRGQYWCSFTVGGDPVTLAYTERTQAWARYDHALHCFDLVPTSGGSPLLLGGWTGYAVALNQGHSDGLNVHGDVAPASSGAVHALTAVADTIDLDVVYARSLAGVAIVIGDQSRTIVSSAAGAGYTRVVVDSAWSPLPAEGDDYYLGGINAYWRSSWFNPSDVPGVRFRGHELRFWLNVLDPASSVDVMWRFDADLEDRGFAFATSKRLLLPAIAGAGTEMWVKFANDKPDAPFEVEGFQVWFQLEDR